LSPLRKVNKSEATPSIKM